MNGDAIGDTASGNTGNFLALLRAYVVIGMVPYDELGRVYEFSPSRHHVASHHAKGVYCVPSL